MFGGIGEKSKQGNQHSKMVKVVSEITLGGIYTNDEIEVPEIDETAWTQLLSAPYQLPSFSSLNIVGYPTNVELGYRISDELISFSYGVTHAKNIQENSIDFEKIGATVFHNNLALSNSLGVGISEQYNSPTTINFKISANNTKGNRFSRNLSINWLHSIYSGVAENKIPSEITADWVKNNLTKTLSNQHPSSKFTGNIGVNERLYYIYPVNFGLRYFKTDLGKEGDSLILTNGLEIKTTSQFIQNLNGVMYAVCKNEQSNIGYSERTLIQ